jgi:pyridoxal phosphate enzyme (YggS family)
LDLGRLKSNLETIRTQIAAAALDAGRHADEVTLVAVTKYVEPDTARALVDLGCFDLGESRPQQLWEKAEALQDLPVRWHQIGHMQRNKLRRSLPLIHLLHAGDSMRLLQSVDKEAEQSKQCVNVLLEVNVSGDSTKHGFSPSELKENLDEILALENLKVNGLMTMAARDGGAAVAAANFQTLVSLRDELFELKPELNLPELSMGMSGDFEAAIAAGATLVRVGSALFEGV